MNVLVTHLIGKKKIYIYIYLYIIGYVENVLHANVLRTLWLRFSGAHCLCSELRAPAHYLCADLNLLKESFFNAFLI